MLHGSSITPSSEVHMPNLSLQNGRPGGTIPTPETHLSQQLPHMFCHMRADWWQKQSLNLNEPYNQVSVHPFQRGQFMVLIPGELQLKEANS